MIVRYIRERGYKGSGNDPLLTLGRDYDILGVIFRPAPYSAQVCIQTNIDAGDQSDGQPYSDGGPGLFNMEFFDVVDPCIPQGWLMVAEGRGYYRLGPREFGGDFWDCFHDGNPEAEKTFARVIEKIKAFHARKVDQE